MSFLNYLGNSYDSFVDSAGWYLRHSNPITILQNIYHGILNIERGTEYPMYFPFLTRHIKFGINELIAYGTHFVRHHEPEINTEGRNDYTDFQRLEYFFNNFYKYQNGTMKNLMYSSQIPRTQLHRMESLYNYTALTFFAYNVISGTALVAVVNFYARSYKPNLLTAAVATIPLYALIWFNYSLSDKVKNYFINNSARRLGYGYLNEGLFKSVPRNVDFTRY